MDVKKAYSILDITPVTSEEEVRAAYRDLVAVWHPDRFAHNARLRNKAEMKLKLLNMAYETIKASGFTIGTATHTNKQDIPDKEPTDTSTKTNISNNRNMRRLWLVVTSFLLIACFVIGITILYSSRNTQKAHIDVPHGVLDKLDGNGRLSENKYFNFCVTNNSDWHINNITVEIIINDGEWWLNLHDGTNPLKPGNTASYDVKIPQDLRSALDRIAKRIDNNQPEWSWHFVTATGNPPSGKRTEEYFNKIDKILTHH